MTLVLDLFAGPGGWDTGLRAAGYRGRVLGVEWDAEACDTARAAGHDRLQFDVAALDPAGFGPVWGLICSPPCQGFSTAGKGKGRDDAVLLLAALADVRTRADLEAALTRLRAHMTDPRSLLALEPLRYALTLAPAWTTWEQVPAVLPIWEACAVVLRRIGYTVATGVLQAEQYGVPQTRRRAILVAHGPDMPTPAALPAPTHSRYYSREPERTDAGVSLWVSMADALGWNNRDLVGFPRRDDGKEAVTINGVDYRARDLRAASRPAQVVTEKARSWQRFQFAGAGATANVTAGQKRRDLTEPAHTITGKGTAAWVDPDQRETRRVTVDEAAVLQSFPAGYPWQGSKTAQYRQVGDAVPPQLARAVLTPILAAAGALTEAVAA